MFNEDELNLLGDIFEDRFAVVNIRILADIGETLKKIEGLTPSQARKLQQMYTYGADLESITRQLANASGQTVAEIEGLYEAVAREGYEWATPYYDAKGVSQILFAENKLLQSMIQSMSAVTAGQLKNISSTTTVGVKTAKGFTNFGTFYQKTIDDAITAVATGVEDYSSVIRQSVRALGKSGLRVEYASGYTRRLDSAVRQNVLDGVSYVAQETARRNGEMFDADGVELSAHSPCAPDHLPYQGRQYSNGEFEELQKSLARPIGEWNCRHFPYPIVLGVSRPANSKSELAEMKRYSNEKVTIEGKDYTRYECTQIQRQLETRLRYAREEKALYEAVGDSELKREVTGQIRVLTNKYAEVSRTAGLPTRLERTKSALATLKTTENARIIKDTIRSAENLVIPESKIFGYALKDLNKAKAFESALGYNQSNGNQLIENIRSNLDNYDAKFKGKTQYGSLYEVEMQMAGANGKMATVKTAWIVDAENGETRLTSVYVTKRKKETYGD